VAARTAITPTREQDYAEWYQQVVRSADLAENSAVRGCMVIKPWGYQLWENMKAVLDRMFKETGHSNAYFPLFIPLSFFQKEAEHVQGFAKECAVVTHHRLEMNSEGKLVPASPLDEPLIVRPTSETIIGETFSRWVQSYRDLPLLINQWANVVRWEMRTRLFLRTAEFLWQEGHTAHETEADAREETMRILEIYRTFAEEYMAMPVLTGEKTAGERFPGAVTTYCIEALMQDRKALQAGTSHFLGQNFAKASGIRYQSREGKEEHAWTTSWGASTRLIGGLIMVHGDDNGAVMPPRLAPAHVALLPIIRSEADKAPVLSYCEGIAQELRKQQYDGRPVEVVVDRRESNAGDRGWDWVKKGIPVRAEVGPRDLEKGAVFFARRDTMEKASLPRERFVATVGDTLADIQKTLVQRARTFLKENTAEVNTEKEFRDYFADSRGGFALAHWNGSVAVEEKVKNEMSVTIRCIPLDYEKSGPGTCPFTGEPSKGRVVFARNY
jgi:prolyl-tRNA synthetase